MEQNSNNDTNGAIESRTIMLRMESDNAQRAHQNV